VDTVREPNSIARVDGQNSVALGIRKQTGTNTVAVVNDVLSRLDTIKETLPKDINIAIRQNQATFIERSIDDIQHHLIYGSLLASLVVFFFLRNIRSTVISALAIPVSLIGTFIVMKALGHTLNNMTLLALSLATGIVIDDAIVVLENIFRYVEEKGVSPRQAASEATAEIGLAVLATTLSLVVIFPARRLHYGSDWTIPAGVRDRFRQQRSCCPCSFPYPDARPVRRMVAAAGCRGHDSHGSKKHGIYARIDTVYGHMLEWSLRHRFAMLMLALAVSGSAVLLLPRIGTELVPEDDQSEFTVNVNLPRGTTLDRTAEYVKDIEPLLLQQPNVQTVFTNIQPNQANYLIGLTPIEERDISQQDMIRRVRSTLQRKYPGTRINVSGGTALSGASTASGGNNYGGGGGGNNGNRLQMLVQGPDIDQLQIYMQSFMEKLRTIPGVVDVGTNFELSQPELRVNVDRIRAADLGVSIDSLAANLRTLVGGEQVSTIKQGDNQYEVQLRLDEQFRDEPAKLGNLLIRRPAARSV
jgi:HAE1 family hydrophobic/amphiphilic exporter-1